MRAGNLSFLVLIFLGFSSFSNADFIFDFGAASKTQIAGWPTVLPGVIDFPPVSGTELFTVGNLINGCGLFPTRPTQSGSGTTCPALGLSGRINYEDTFTLDEDTEALLQLFIKVGHPEDTTGRFLNQRQTETFDIFLNGTSLELAQLLDDVTGTDLSIQNGYYLYTYQPAIIPAGTWFPTFVSREGSIEFLARLTAISSTTSEPVSLVLLGSGLFGLGFLGRRRS